MSFATLPPSADLSALPLMVTASAYARGVTYAETGRVMRVQWDDESHLLTGLVRGRGSVYQTTVRFSTGEPQPRFLGGVCTCPMEVDCKHVVAVVTAAQPVPELAAPTPATWEDSLAELLGQASPGEPEPESGSPLAIQLSIIPGRGGKPALRARPARLGKTGWVNGNLSWAHLSVGYYTRGFIADHARLLEEFHAVYRARAQTSFYMSNDKEIDLTEFESTNLWPLLDEAASCGVRLVHSTKSLGEVKPYRHAQFRLDIAQDGTGGLTLCPIITVDGHDSPVTALAFIGTDAHGLAYTPAERVGDVSKRRLHLARFGRTVPRQLADMALSGQHMTIPADGADRFMGQYYLKLRRLASITSGDGSVAPPTVSPPALAVRADYEPDHEVSLGLEWVYRVDRAGGEGGRGDRGGGEGGRGGRSMHAPLGPVTSDMPFRDEELEQKLLADVRMPLEQLGFHDDVTGELGDFAHLSGLDTMRFTTEVLPLLDDHPSFEIDIRGEPADYRAADDSLTIGIAADDTDDPDWFDLGVTVSAGGRDVPLADVIAALSSDEQQLLLPDGTYFALDRPELHRLRQLLEEARALRDGSPKSLRISRYQAGLWEELTALGVVERQAEAWQRQAEGLLEISSGLAGRRDEWVEPVPAPEGLRAQLRPYQAEGFTWLSFLWQHQLGGILADDMGLGKTVQTLALICHAKRADPGLAPVLIVAPTSVVPNWAAEAARFAPDLRVAVITETQRKRGHTIAETLNGAGADIVVTSYTLFRLGYDDDYAPVTWSGLVLDEAQHVKNHQSKAYQAVRRLPAPVKLAITGTPMENNLMELWSLLSITAPGLFPSPVRFQEFYARPIEKGHNTERLTQLRQRIRPLVKRRTKEQVVSDLPEKQEQLLEVDLHPKHRAVYDRHLQRERQKVLGLVDDMTKNRFTILRSLTLLRQLSLHAGLVDDTHSNLASAKVDALLEHLADVVGSGHRALVFSQFTGFLGAVRSGLDEEDVPYAYLDGSTRDRGQVIDEFKSGSAAVFLISLKAGGFGLNLTEADYVFLLDPWWNPATEAQAIDRTHRIGQTRNVMVYRLIARDTIEQKVMALKQRKAELFSSVMDDGNAFGSALTADDVRNLFT